MNINKTVELKELLNAIQTRSKDKGDGVKVNFVEKCLKKVNPDITSIINVVNDAEWKYLPRPDDFPEGPVKPGTKEEKELVEVKNRYYKQWLEQLNKGQFDPEGAKSTPKEEDPEEVDMVALAKQEKNEPETAPIEQIQDTVMPEPEEPEDRRERYEEEDKELEDKQLPELKKTLDKVADSSGDMEAEADLLVALNGYVDSRLISESFDLRKILALEEQIKELKESIPGLVKEALRKQFQG